MNIAEFFLYTVNRSITAGIVILVVLPVRALLGKLNVPRRYIYLLWLIPALRLLCPVTLSSTTSLFNLPVFDRAVQTEEGMVYLPKELMEWVRSGEQFDEERGGVQAGAYGMGAVRRNIGETANYYGGRVFEQPSQHSYYQVPEFAEDGLYHQVAESVEDGSYRQMAEFAENGSYHQMAESAENGSYHQAAEAAENGLYHQTAGATEDGSYYQAAEYAESVDWQRIILPGLTAVWLAGVGILAFWQLYAYGRIRRQVACAVRLPGESGGNVYECENIHTPFTMGPIRCRIYIPCYMEKREREYVLLHEQYHIRRHDLWVRLLACVLQVIYWYNPLIWLGNRCMEGDMEMRCDEYVLEQLGEDIRYDYSLSLLSYAAGRRYRTMDVTAFGESGTGKRVNHVLKYKKTGICVAVLAVAAILLVSAICLTDRASEADMRQEALLREDMGASEEKTYFWGQQELKLEFPRESVNPVMSLAGRSVISLTPKDEEGSYGSGISCVGEHCFFLVRPFYREEDTIYELQVFDGDRKEWSSGFLEMELLEQGYIYNMFAVSDQELVYLVPVRDAEKSWKYEAYYAVHMSRTGEEQKRVDLLPACMELDLVQDGTLPANFCVDSQGNYYMLSFDGKQMVILDEEGKLISSRDCSIRNKRVIPWMTAGPDGGILTQGYHEENGMEWLWLKGTQERSLGTARGVEFGDRIIPRENGRYFYITGEKKIYQGDGTAAAEYLFDAGSIIGAFGEVAVNEEGEVLLFTVRKDCAVAYVLSRAGETRMGEGGEKILISTPLYAVNISRHSLYWGVERTLPMFMAEHPEYAFDLKVSEEEERSAVHDRVWNELIAGKGPDLFVINAEELPALWEKGVLMDLRELVSPETLDQIYPGLLATGTIDGSLAGISTYYNIQSLLTDSELWTKEEWTVEEVITLLERGERPHGICRGFEYGGGSTILYLLTCFDMSNSPFINWEEGTCSFDSDLFIRLLKAAQKYQNDLQVEVETRDGDSFLVQYQELMDKNCLAVQDIIMGRRDYVQIRQLLGERYNRPGIPGVNGSRQVVNPISFVVVNKNCKNKQAVAAYLEYIMGPKLMGDYRRDCRDTFEVVRDWEGRWCETGETIEGLYSYTYPLDKNDPSIRSEEMPSFFVEYLQWCEDYYTLMESLEGSVPVDNPITDIIQEEADNFFEGGQSAEHVAEVIQKRVQLYLSEQQ